MAIQVTSNALHLMNQVTLSMFQIIQPMGGVVITAEWRIGMATLILPRIKPITGIISNFLVLITAGNLTIDTKMEQTIGMIMDTHASTLDLITCGWSRTRQ